MMTNKMRREFAAMQKKLDNLSKYPREKRAEIVDKNIDLNIRLMHDPYFHGEYYEVFNIH